ncbi:MAG: DUF1697 domain-containing protein [Bryobacteraceae bacterium]
MSQPKALSTHVALLRGINVGGKNILPMKDLAQIFLDAGCADARTYIQSGNVIFKAPSRLLENLCGGITERIGVQFGYQIPVVLRTAAQLADAIANNPFMKPGADLKALFVLFLADLPGAQAIAKLDPDRSLPDAFVVRNREVYLHLPNGAARTKLTNSYFDSKLATVSTFRNWATVLKLLELMQAS